MSRKANNVNDKAQIASHRPLCLDPSEASLDWIGMKVRARYLRNSKLKPTDVYFVPAETADGGGAQKEESK